jgi:hypothetical protein
MSNALPTTALRDAVAAAVLAAWSPASIDYGKPKTPITVFPCAIILTTEPQTTIETAVSIQVVQEFTIVGRWHFPGASTTLVEESKDARFNELQAQLITGPTFAAGAYLPQLTTGSWDEMDDIPESAYELTATFSCMYRVARS